MSYIKTYWPEEAIKCDLCTDIIQKNEEFYFEDVDGVALCEACYKVKEKANGNF